MKEYNFPKRTVGQTKVIPTDKYITEVTRVSGIKFAKKEDPMKQNEEQ